tara:strand:+ start:621 stop:1112 length:492 start_codon:yes stop_codon:yes gene_type:complete
MAKLVIQTQYRENYAAHNEDYVHGVSEPYWKFKGGETYVMENLSVASINEIASGNLMDNIKSDIEYSHEAVEEYILDWSIEEDDASVCEAWENPVTIDVVGSDLQCTQVVPNGEHGYMRSEIASCTRTWTLKRGSNENFFTVYTMEDGAVVSAPQLQKYLEAA